MLESFLYWGIKFAGAIVRKLPDGPAMGLGRAMGTVAYAFDTRRRNQVYVNLKIAFSTTKSLAEIKQISREVFKNFGQSVIEVLRLPLINKSRFSEYVHFEGRENVDEAVKRGKGVILLAMHYGSWELASLSTAMFGRPYKVIVNPQKRFPRLDALLNSYRECGGTVAISKGFGIRDFIRSLQNNELVGMVMDQGGKDGVLVPFFGRRASMAVGAIRIALKMDVPICFCAIERQQGAHHKITIHPALELERSADPEQDIRRNVLKVTRIMEDYIRRNPAEYMWFYKIWKYSNEAVIAILNDGRTGHLRQSQTVAGVLEKVLHERQTLTTTHTFDVVYRNKFAARLMSVIGLFANGHLCRRRLGFMFWFLTKASFDRIMSVKADFVISCGSRAAAVNYLLASDQQAKSIAILKPGLLSFNRFDLVILPQHDYHANIHSRTPVAVTRGAPNLISPEYLKAQETGLVRHFSHLTIREKLMIGFLIGGDTKAFSLTEQKVRVAMHQILEAAEQLDAEILVTTSRRTSARIEQMLFRELKKNRRCRLLVLANRANVPEAVGGILSMSDILVVSGDSISMMSEAAGSGKKTIVFPLQNILNFSPEKFKHDRFVETLHNQGFILSSQANDIRQAIYSLVRNKIQLKTLADQEVIYDALKKIV